MLSSPHRSQQQPAVVGRGRPQLTTTADRRPHAGRHWQSRSQRWPSSGQKWPPSGHHSKDSLKQSLYDSLADSSEDSSRDSQKSLRESSSQPPLVRPPLAPCDHHWPPCGQFGTPNSGGQLGLPTRTTNSGCQLGQPTRAAQLGRPIRVAYSGGQVGWSTRAANSSQT